jgi:F-type H+-transporting ATPase subunit epsilon
VAETIQLEIVTPYGTIYSEPVEEFGASGTEGDFGVYPGHAPMLTSLQIGEISARKGNVTDWFFVSTGFAEVGPEKIIVLADSAEHATAIDVARAAEAKKRAEERIAKASEIDFRRAELALQRALARMSVAERSRGR